MTNVVDRTLCHTVHVYDTLSHCRHVSTTNIDEISSGGDSCLYRSVENLTASLRRDDGGLEHSGDEVSDYHARSLMEGRAISCSDLLLDIERPKVHTQTNLGLLLMDLVIKLETAKISTHAY